jgi:hypothetical protein
MTLAFNLLSAFSFDTVAVFTQDYRQVFQSARSIKAVVKEEAKVMEHPLETGAVITDHRIILPVEIELSLILKPSNYKDTYEEIKQYYLNSTLLIVQTRSGLYDNQLISSMPHEEDTELFNTIAIALSLKQVIFVNAQYGVAPKNPKNSTTTNRGTQQGAQASRGQTTGAQDIWYGTFGST